MECRQRERKDCEEENSVCFWLLLDSYVWIHRRCFSLSSCARLLYLNLKQPISQSSIHSFLLHPLLTFLLSMSAAFPLCSLLSSLWVASPACCPPPAPPVSICSDEARLCVRLWLFYSSSNIFHIFHFSSPPLEQDWSVKQMGSLITHLYSTCLLHVVYALFKCNEYVHMCRTLAFQRHEVSHTCT